MTQTEDVEARKENERLEKEIEGMRDKLNLMESQFDDERKTLKLQIDQAEKVGVGLLSS